MTSPYERPDRAALDAVAQMVASVGEELAAWRRRALEAEAALSRAPAPAAGAPAVTSEEVAELRQRLARARELVDLLRTRLRFLEERSEGAA